MAEINAIGPEDRRFASNTVLFRHLTTRLYDQLLRHAFVRRFSKGEFVFRIGETPQFLHIMLDGCVALTGHGAEERTTVIEFLEPGECFVLAAVALGQPYLLSGCAASDSRLMHIPAARLRSMTESNKGFALATVETLSLQWPQLVGQITDLKLKSSAQRLGAYLLMLAKGATGSEVRLPSERQFVAARLGMTPESLSRAFARLRALGVVGHGQTVSIKDAKRLRGFCDGRESG